MIRVGVLGAHYTITITRNPQNSIGIYLGPYSNVLRSKLFPKYKTMIKVDPKP